MSHLRHPTSGSTAKAAADPTGEAGLNQAEDRQPAVCLTVHYRRPLAHNSPAIATGKKVSRRKQSTGYFLFTVHIAVITQYERIIYPGNSFLFSFP